MVHIGRRFFLQQSALIGAATLGAPIVRAIEPISRTAGSHFKFSLAAYSYRDLFKAKEKRLTIDEFLDDCAKFGLDGTELTSYYLPQNALPGRSARRSQFATCRLLAKPKNRQKKASTRHRTPGNGTRGPATTDKKRGNS